MTARFLRSRSEMRSRSALDTDAYCEISRRKQLDDELVAIRMHSQTLWSRPDTSLTTNGHYYADPEQKERTLPRPTSAGRHHNPHPKLVFMRTGMREIPNAYGALPAARSPLRERIIKKKPIAADFMEQLQGLSPYEIHGVNAFLKLANDDAKPNVVEAVKKYRIMMANEYECPPIGAATICREDGSRTEYYPSIDQFQQATKNDEEIQAINQVLENPETEVKIINKDPPQQQQQPIVTRISRSSNRAKTHFQRENHSHSQCPWPLARRPFRGDFSIHYDWHPRLPHHRLTCLC